MRLRPSLPRIPSELPEKEQRPREGRRGNLRRALAAAVVAAGLTGPASPVQRQETLPSDARVLSLATLDAVAQFAQQSGGSFAHWISPEGEVVGDVRIVWSSFQEVFHRVPTPLELELARQLAEQTGALADPARLGAVLEEYRDIIPMPEAQALANTGLLGALEPQEFALLQMLGQEGLQRIQRKRQYYGAVLEGMWEAARDRLRFHIEGGGKIIAREEDIPSVFAPEIARLSPENQARFVSGLQAVFREEAAPLAHKAGAEVSKRFLFTLYLWSIVPPGEEGGHLPQPSSQGAGERG